MVDKVVAPADMTIDIAQQNSDSYGLTVAKNTGPVHTKKQIIFAGNETLKHTIFNAIPHK